MNRIQKTSENQNQKPEVNVTYFCRQVLVTMISPLAKQATGSIICNAYGGKLKLVSHIDQKNCHCNIFAAFDKYLFMEYILSLIHI